MMKVNNFLGCFKLETGGLIIGWINLVSYIISFMFSIAGIVFLCAYNCDNFKEIANQIAEGKEGGEPMNSTTEERFYEVCRIARPAAIVFFIISSITATGFAFIAFLCIKGTENRDHVRIKPMMIVMALLSIFSFLGILSFDFEGVIGGIVSAFYYGYLFVVLYSLYDNFQLENLNRIGFSVAHYQTAYLEKS